MKGKSRENVLHSSLYTGWATESTRSIWKQPRNFLKTRETKAHPPLWYQQNGKKRGGGEIGRLVPFLLFSHRKVGFKLSDLTPYLTRWALARYPQTGSRPVHFQFDAAPAERFSRGIYMDPTRATRRRGSRDIMYMCTLHEDLEPFPPSRSRNPLVERNYHASWTAEAAIFTEYFSAHIMVCTCRQVKENLGCILGCIIGNRGVHRKKAAGQLVIHPISKFPTE